MTVNFITNGQKLELEPLILYPVFRNLLPRNAPYK